ncbi:raffinose/stachyose/melibiose transport system substrate-binding protein [Friedmanniella endophytica]|uniref:Raffinose/stachyose/melibiose transport system substrate-binding protein n=1 Tax=Microlunatus kandeliicorticis TaxID=1759536 RepID=A0A7W3IQB5_9ACTN|nr:extracellular solute-binding protein [Microlunatus kandeliicorticis]MBA8793296.1 raffinose/stachyose/melibiose transport system substrate-binding protein [Microlunatus kandeliicorticis]
MDPRITSRRKFLGLALGVPASAAALAACGGTTPTQTGAAGGGGNGGGDAGSTSYWFLTGQPGQGIREDTVKRFNAANASSKIAYTEFANDAYKTKIKTALGAGQGPSIIWGWGGGGLQEYVKNDQVEDLTDWFGQNDALKQKLFASSFAAATVNDKIYAMPCETVAPIVLYYNKSVFDKVGAQPPSTWTDVMNLVDRFNGAGVAPFSLGGQSRWTNMMWLEFLLDRIGGSGVFQNVFEGKSDAWSDPAVTEMLTKIQDLVKAKGFVKGFSSITADSNADQALLYTGKAAMMLHGSWTYGSMKESGGDFVTGGHLGYMNFPTVEGGKGDPSDTVGNPGQYLSISAKATDAQKEAAKKFFSTTVLDDTETQAWVKAGNVPIVNGADKNFGSGGDADFLSFVYKTASGAKNFAQSWDQALSPTQAETLLDNIAKLFQLSVTPEQWVENMNKAIGS